MKVKSGNKRRQQTVLVDNDNSGGLTFGQFLLLMIVLVIVFVVLWEWILKDIFFPPEPSPGPSGSGGAPGSPSANVLEPYEKSVTVYDITLIVVLVAVILMTIVPIPLRLFLDLEPVVWGYAIGGIVFAQCISGTIMYATTFNAFQRGRDAWPNNPEVVAEDISWEGITVASVTFLIASTIAMFAVFLGGAIVPGPVAFLAWLFFFVVPLTFLIWYVVGDFNEYDSGDALMILMVVTTAVNGIMAVLLMLKTVQFVKNQIPETGSKLKDLYEKLRRTEQKLLEIEDSAEKTFEREKLKLQQQEVQNELEREEAGRINENINDII